MEKLTGTFVSEGIAIGQIQLLPEAIEVVKEIIEDKEAEIKRYNEATQAALTLTDELINKATDAAAREILEIHKMMLEDLDFTETVINGINEFGYNASYAVKEAGSILSKIFSSMDDEYMKARSADVKDVADVVIKVLAGQTNAVFDEPRIFVGKDIMPSQLVELDPKMILGFAFSEGSVNSHSGIVARNMSIPMVCQINQDLTKYDGQFGIVDGKAGVFIVNPDQDTLKEYEKKQKEYLDYQKMLVELKGKADETIDGRHLKIKANIGKVEDVKKALANDAAGIGLFRSEFLFLDSPDYPSENDQFKAYKEVAEKMEGKEVVIRTLDIGADKTIPYFDLPVEKNPALGYRAVRICLDRVPLFKTQLRAILRASAFGNIAIMVPMIISVEEVKEVKRILAEVKAELDEKGIAYKKDIRLGIMIETPASVIISDLLAQEVDFFSIGTNDLTQYTLAVDRENQKVKFDKHHVAILRMLKMIVDNAHKYGTRVCICGELGADLDLTEYYLAIGLDEVSVSPPAVLKVRNKVRNLNYSDIQKKNIHF